MIRITTPLDLAIVLLVCGVLGFWLVAPEGTIPASLKFAGYSIRYVIAKIKSWFNK